VRFWLLKSEPDTFSIDDLKARPGETEHWDGVRNYQARNYLREMRCGDLAFFYHSNCDEPGIVGIVSVVREAYPDFTAFDPASPYYDPRSDPARPRWFMVDVQHKKTFRRPVTLRELKKQSELSEMALLRRGNRLSVMPISETEWQCINSLRSSKSVKQRDQSTKPRLDVSS
jgi:predicted RNA-binding protein with PUA-like domain